MKNKYFENAVEWSETNKNNVGLPRPFAYTINKKRKKIKISKIVPIPWQSLARFNIGHLLGLNEENENIVYENNLCPYCGIKINNEETVIRWYNCDLILLSKNDRWVYSDVHPFHLECMKEGRIFCPYMSTLKDLDFEIGKYKELKQNAINDVIKSKELRSEKNIKENAKS
jgi:hypothetical protein